VGRLLPIVVTLVLVSCTGVPTNPAASPSPASIRPDPDFGGVPTLAKPVPSPTASSSVVPSSSSPVGERLASAQADFDCDGRPDLLEFFNAPRPGTYESVQAGKLARLTLGAGGVTGLPFDGMPFDDPGRSPLIGIADVNGDGCDDAIVTVGRGASTTWTSFLVYDGNDFKRVEEDGKPAMFLFGGSVRHGNAIECRTRKDATEIVARAVSDYISDYQWDAVEDVHHWSTKSQLVLWSTSRSVILVSDRGAMPTDVERYWGLSCGSVKLSG
jgi:hypothetical protein